MINGLKADFVVAFVILDIAIILVMARLVGALALRIRQPRVVGEIVAGILLGPSLLGPVIFTWGNAPAVLHCDVSRLSVGVGVDPAAFKPPPPSITQCLFPTQARSVLSLLGQVALIFFMFLVGLQLDLSGLKGKLRGVFTVALGVVAAPLVGGLLIGPALHNSKFAATSAAGTMPTTIGFSLFVAGTLAVTAFPVMARILQEKQLITSPMGVIGVSAAAVVTVAMFLLLGVAKGVAGGMAGTGLAKIFIGTAVYLAVMAVPVRLALAPLGRRIEAAGAVDSTAFAVFVIVAMLSAYAADRIGINVIVGGFVAGAVLPARVLAFREVSARLGEVTATILLPIFLAFSGLRTDFTSLRAKHVPGILLVLVVGIIAKWGAGLLAARAGGLSWAEGQVLGALMNCRGLLVLVVGIIATDSGIFTPQMQLATVVMALVTTAMTGPLVDYFVPRLSREPVTAGAATSASASPVA